MNTVNNRVNLGFATYSDSNLGDFTDNITAGLTGNPNFPAPTVSPTILGAQRATFATDVTNAAQGGTPLTAIKNAMKKVLVNSLRKNAAYVQSIAGQDAAMLLSSGFQANSTNRAQVQLAVPMIMAVLNEMSTMLTVRLRPVGNARAYQLRVSADNGVTWQTTMDSTQARRIVVHNLTPAMTYTLQSRAVGGSMGYSDWSASVTHIAQ